MATTSEELGRLGSSDFRDVIGRFASGVTVITAQHEDQAYGTTASAVSSLSLEPPMVLICLNKGSSTGQAIAASRRFAINILGEDQADAAMRFGRKGPDKFQGAAVVPGAAGEPLLSDALATLECRVVDEVTGGTHSVFLAEVDHATARPGAPLAYFRGQFGRLELAQDESAYRDIRARVMSRDIPVGRQLGLDDVASLVGLPRGPVYHALTKLTGEGLVTRTPHGSYVVTPLTLPVIEDGLRARCAIELGVASSTVGRLSAEQLAELRAVMERTRPDPATDAFDIAEHLRTYAAFHEYFVGLAGSSALLDAHRRVNAPAMIMSATSGGAVADHAYVDAANSAFRHHTALVEAYEAGDAAAASATIRCHIEDSIAFTRRHIRASGGEI